MERVDIEELDREPHPMGVNRERRDIGAAVGTENVAMVHYELEPGEQFSGGCTRTTTRRRSSTSSRGRRPSSTASHGAGRPTRAEREPTAKRLRSEPARSSGSNRGSSSVAAMRATTPSRRWHSRPPAAGTTGRTWSHSRPAGSAARSPPTASGNPTRRSSSTATSVKTRLGSADFP